MRTLLAIALYKSAQPERALQQVDAAVQMLPRRSGPRLVQAWIRQANNDLKGAIEAGEKSLSINARRWITRRWLKQAYAKSGNVRRQRLMEAFLKRIGKDSPATPP